MQRRAIDIPRNDPRRELQASRVGVPPSGGLGALPAPPPKGGTPTHATQGFALVIALSMMAFVLVLLLSMTLLVQVETTNSRQALNQLRAKESARLALMMALGDLQRYAGPDQRVTARAEILGSSIPDSNRKWTGVWNTTTPNSDPIWLVSNNQNLDIELSPTSSINIQHGYDPNNDGSYNELEAFAPTEVSRLEINSSGDEIAWWVSDEGVKAPIKIVEGIEDKVAALPDGDLYLDYDGETGQLLPALHDQVFDFRDLIDVTLADESSIQKLERIQSRDNISILAQSLDANIREGIDAELVHSATSNNAFVLSNPTDGGLKKDLSYLKVLDPTATSQSNLDTLYSDPDSLITPAAVELINFKGNPTAFPSDEIMGMRLPYATVQEAHNETANFTIAPVITEFQFITGVAADGQGASLDTTKTHPYM